MGLYDARQAYQIGMNYIRQLSDFHGRSFHFAAPIPLELGSLSYSPAFCSDVGIDVVLFAHAIIQDRKARCEANQTTRPLSRARDRIWAAIRAAGTDPRGFVRPPTLHQVVPTDDSVRGRVSCAGSCGEVSLSTVGSALARVILESSFILKTSGRLIDGTRNDIFV